MKSHNALKQSYSKQNAQRPAKKNEFVLDKNSLVLPAPLKYKLYSDSVQSPNDTVKALEEIYLDNFNKSPLLLREDFCGTFLVGCEWVKSDPKRRALGLDLAEEPLRFAKKNISNKLNTEERQRAIFNKQDVRVPTIPRVEVISAENFSFYIFKKRQELVSYFRAAFTSLTSKGILALDMIGGAGFTDTPNDSRRTIKRQETGLPCDVTYRWRQRDFNALSNEAKYHIDFKIRDSWYKDVFTYDWRIWSIPEVTEALIEAGFNQVKIYWEDEKTKPAFKPVTEISGEWETWACVAVGIKD